MKSKYGLFVLVLGLSFASLNAQAVDDPAYLAPPAVEKDINSVDLLSGRYEAEIPELSIPAAPRLSFKHLQQFVVRVEGTKYQSTPLFAREEPVDPTKPVDPEDPIDAAMMAVAPTTFDFTYQGNTSERIKCDMGECIPEENYGSFLTGSFQGATTTSLQYRL